ncbi:MAG: dTDP-4-dehydrorhamnose reductase [Coriobacteriia bacterium]|nr:dTDP-4-dehydrorhamnose reductase [Coriobacteriia bacterium]
MKRYVDHTDEQNKRSRVLITGARGQVGALLAEHYQSLDHVELLAPARSELDLSEPHSITSYLKEQKPDLILHMGAYTNVDQAEDEPELCFAINTQASKMLADFAREQDKRMILMSSDYVFDGSGSEPWPERLSLHEPLNVYGESKKRAEHYFLESKTPGIIVRTSWVFAHGGKNFIDTMLKLARDHESLQVVDDQVSSPTYARDLVVPLSQLASNVDASGIVHLTNRGYCSWYELCAYAFKKRGLKTMLTPVSSEEFPRKARRPKNSRLVQSRNISLGLLPMPRWQDAVKRYLLERNEAQGCL